jgi:ribosomal protein S27E
MAPFLKIDCEDCGTTLIVGQAETFGEVGDELGEELEMQIALGNVAVDDEAGFQLVWADVHRVYRCPKCGAGAELHPKF